MVKQNISIEDVVDFLNEFLKMDPDCANALMFHREKCNDLVANHPTIQVHQYKGDEFPKVGLLGLLNGMLGIREDGMGPLCVEIDENGKIDEFRKTE